MNTDNQAKNSDVPQYDPGIAPAESAARKEREGSNFGDIKGDVSDDSGDRVSHDSIDVTGGQTIDQEGLANNYAIEPEMYINEPGDLREEEAQKARERAQTLDEIKDNEEQGRLSDQADTRSRGPGQI